MKIIEKARVQNAFKTDCEGKGKFAENVFVNYFRNNPKNEKRTLFDVSKIIDYQNTDIDFVIDKKGDETLPSFEEVMENNDRYVKVEVKFNTPALKTGKIAYEINSHGRIGWALKTKCDYIFNVFGEEVNNSYSVKKIGIIDFPLWKKHIDEKTISTEKYHIKSENITNILTPLNEMEGKKILKYINNIKTTDKAF